MSFFAFSKEDVLKIHALLIAKFGGLDGLRDDGLLESTLAQPFQSFGGKELYPSIQAKACRYAFGVIKNHPFIDGNKRTAAALLGVYLRMSGCIFEPDHMAAITEVESKNDFHAEAFPHRPLNCMRSFKRKPKRAYWRPFNYGAHLREPVCA